MIFYKRHSIFYTYIEISWVLQKVISERRLFLKWTKSFSTPSKAFSLTISIWSAEVLEKQHPKPCFFSSQLNTASFTMPGITHSTPNISEFPTTDETLSDKEKIEKETIRVFSCPLLIKFIN